MSATRGGLGDASFSTERSSVGAASSIGAGGRASTMAVSSSPMPRPCSAGWGTPWECPGDRDRAPHSRPFGVGFVGGVEDRLARAPEHRHRFAIGVGHPRLRVEDAEHDVRFRHRQPHLLANAHPHRVVVIEVEAAGVDEHIRSTDAPHVGVVPIARHARLVVDDGERTPHEAVEEAALADVRLADDGYDRARVHVISRTRARPGASPIRSSRASRARIAIDRPSCRPTPRCAGVRRCRWP